MDFKNCEDVQEIGAILETVSEKMPALIKSLINTMYSEEAGAQMGKAVGNMYKELIDAGMDKADAMTLVKEYINVAKNMTIK